MKHRLFLFVGLNLIFIFREEKVFKNKAPLEISGPAEEVTEVWIKLYNGVFYDV
jgi:hypothetical protein